MQSNPKVENKLTFFGTVVMKYQPEEDIFGVML